MDVGAYHNDENGINYIRVRVYGHISYYWVNIGDDIDVNIGGDYSGYSVIIYGDGKTVGFFGAPSNDINGIDSGRVRFYTKEGTTGETSSVPSSIPNVIPSSNTSEYLRAVLYSSVGETPSSKISSLLYLYPSEYPYEQL